MEDRTHRFAKKIREEREKYLSPHDRTAINTLLDDCRDLADPQRLSRNCLEVTLVEWISLVRAQTLGAVKAELLELVDLYDDRKNPVGVDLLASHRLEFWRKIKSFASGLNSYRW